MVVRQCKLSVPTKRFRDSLLRRQDIFDRVPAVGFPADEENSTLGRVELRRLFDDEGAAHPNKIGNFLRSLLFRKPLE
jgi:hypothetical protein